MSTPLHELGALELRAAYRAGETDPTEVVEALLERTAQVGGARDGGVNAFTEVLAEEAKEQAARASDVWAKARRDGQEPPILTGIPVATKEKHALAGHTLEQGLGALAGNVAEADHPVVERLRAAGGIIHARTTSPEFSCATVTHSPLWGVTRNPYLFRASPGGSSGGAGAALAARLTPLATASDIAGSTRIPAGFTGTVGYKAPYGRIPGAAPLCLDTYRGDGPMGRSVLDTALLADVMSGRHPEDHSSWGGPGSLLSALQHAGPGVRGLRVGVSVTLGNFPVQAPIAAAVESAAAALAGAGAELVPVHLPWTTAQIRETFMAHFGHLLAPAMRAVTRGGPPLAAYTERFMEEAEAVAARVDHLGSVTADARLQAQLAAAMEGLDALLVPTNAVTMLGADGDYLDGIDVDGVHLEHYWEAHMTSPFNVANRHPVLSVPAGLSPEGVPIGVQVVGRALDELTTFRVAQALESSLGPLAAPDLAGFSVPA